MSEDYKFSLQFVVDGQQMLNLNISELKIFEKDDYNCNNEMLIKPIKRSRDEQLEHMLNSINLPILEKIRILNFTIVDDPHVKPYVKNIIELIINEIAYINRVKMERLHIIMRMGISPLCNDKTMEALTDFEHLLSIFYMQDLKTFGDEQRYEFRKRICQLDAADNDIMIKYIEKLNLELSLSDKFIDLINNTEIESPKQCLMMFMKYMKTPCITESCVRSIDSIRNVINCLNDKLTKFPNFPKSIIFSNICISMILKGNELYVDFYGYVNEWINGSFSVDFNRLKNKINNNLPYYIFYLVTCCYCHLYRTNVLRIKIDVPIHNMFIFFDESYYRRIKVKVDHFEVGFHHESIFKHLQKFFQLEGYK